MGAENTIAGQMTHVVSPSVTRHNGNGSGSAERRNGIGQAANVPTFRLQRTFAHGDAEEHGKTQSDAAETGEALHREESLSSER